MHINMVVSLGTNKYHIQICRVRPSITRFMTTEYTNDKYLKASSLRTSMLGYKYNQSVNGTSYTVSRCCSIWNRR